MAIPDKKLELEFDANKLPMRYLPMMDEDESPLKRLNLFRKFLIQYSTNWTREEIDEILLDELGKVSNQVMPAIEAAAVPLASLPSSKTGQE